MIISNTNSITGKPLKYLPVLAAGIGRITFSDNASLGIKRSPFSYGGYICLDARSPNSLIIFGRYVWVNNKCSFISEGEGIEIGPDTLIGVSCEIFDSDFHDITPSRRLSGKTNTGLVIIDISTHK